MRVCQTTWKNIRRSPYQALAALGIMVLTFFIISIFALISYGSEKILAYFETRPQITAFLKDEITQKQIEAIKNQLNQTEKVASLKYISKDEALAIYREQNKEDPLLLEMVTAEILPASFEVAAIDSASLPELAEILKTAEGVDEVLFQEDVVATLTSWTETIRKIGLILTSFLILISVLVVLIIIGMKISIKKKEIAVLRLLGASAGYVVNPFLLEGMIYGALGAFLAWGLAFLSLLYATPFLVSFLGEINILPVPLPLILGLLAVEALLGSIMGGFASFLAVRRYLR